MMEIFSNHPTKKMFDERMFGLKVLYIAGIQQVKCWNVFYGSLTPLLIFSRYRDRKIWSTLLG